MKTTILVGRIRNALLTACIVGAAGQSPAATTVTPAVGPGCRAQNPAQQQGLISTSSGIVRAVTPPGAPPFTAPIIVVCGLDRSSPQLGNPSVTVSLAPAQGPGSTAVLVASSIVGNQTHLQFAFLAAAPANAGFTDVSAQVPLTNIGPTAVITLLVALFPNDAIGTIQVIEQ